VKPSTRKRAVGTRDRVLAHLASAGEVRDATGMASTVLADAVGYPGSSIAFAQLLSGMERSGLIKREVRGKRTYRITAARNSRSSKTARPAAAPRGSGLARVPHRPGSPVRPAASQAADPDTAELPPGRDALAGDAPLPGHARQPGGDPGAALPPSDDAADFDYDELARRLLVQVVRRLAAEPNDLAGRPRRSVPAGRGGAGAAASPEAGAGGPEHPDEARDSLEESALRQTVASLERKLASVQSRQLTLAEENEKLRKQLHEAQRSLARVQERASRARITEQLGTAEEALLQRLLALAGTAGQAEGAEAG
jgi:hypothetical protein